MTFLSFVRYEITNRVILYIAVNCKNTLILIPNQNSDVEVVSLCNTMPVNAL